MQLAAKLKLRERLAKARMCCERQALASFHGRRIKPTGRLLCYHSIGQPELGVNDCSPERFRRHLKFAKDLGFRFVPAAQIANGLGGSRDIAVTFDDGWKSVFTVAAPLLAEHEIPMTLFVATGLIEGQSDWHRPRMVTWDQVGELSKMGVEIGSHSVTHPDFGTIDRQMAVDELTGSRITLKSRLGLEVDSFAIPFGQSKNWTPIAQQAARQAGYNLIYAQAENTRPLGTIPRTFVTWMDSDRIFNALLEGVFDDWEEWY
ncbi:MAG: polysaccharide deacetylase family protein [Acidobacteriaceae bacterium]|nr:polysaccharide deacetylase family protein [Acidobacteriaceae bacterium]